MNNFEIESIVGIKEMGSVIKEARKRARLTQDELAEKIGSKRSYISRIERDATSIKLSTLQRIVEDGLGGKLDINIIV